MFSLVDKPFMFHRRFEKCVSPSLALTLFFAFISVPANAQLQITQWGYDSSHTTANVSETVLTTANVNQASFGKVGTYTVDGVIFAQPLYLQGVTLNGAVTNVLYVATMHNVVYAFNADSPGSAPLWTRDYRPGGEAPIPYTDPNAANPTLNITGLGIFGTPVIDPALNCMFFVTSTGTAATPILHLHAIDIRTGAELATATISATYQGATLAHVVNRPGLAVVSGQVVVALGSEPPGDLDPYSGWVLTYNEKTLAQTGAFVASTSLSRNGIWGSGAAPSIDSSGRFYFAIGNGSAQYNGTTEFNESVLQFTYNGGLKLSNWFTPDNWSYLDGLDLDVGCSGTAIIPGTDLLLAGGKTSDVYVTHMSNMGHLVTGNTQLAQLFHVGTGTVAQFNDYNRIIQFAIWPKNPSGKSSVFVWPGEDYLRRYDLTGTTLAQVGGTGSLQGPGEESTLIALSANGSQSGTGILWGNRSINVAYSGGVLYAYNAENVTQELWDSNQNSSRDGIGYPSKFVPPVIANGRVYMATDDGHVYVYGLLTSGFTLSGNASVNATPGTSATDAINVVPSNGFKGTVSFSATTTLPNASISFNPASSTTGTTVNVSVPANTAAGTYPVTVTGTSGAVTATFSFNVNVSAPDFTLTLNPASVSVIPGGTTSTTISIAASGGFNSSVSISVGQLPSGVTGTLSGTTGSSTLTISASSAAAIGQSTVTITGSGGGVTHTANLTISVVSSSTNVLTTGCVFIMNPQATGSFYPFVPGTSSGFNAGCDLYVNSSANSLKIPSGNGIAARSVNVVGPASGASVSGANITPAPKYGVAVTPDPLAFLAAPALGACTATNANITSASTLSPGTYCGGLTINGATVTLNPGLYIVAGPLNINNGATVKGAGVTFYLTAPSGTTNYGPLNILGSTVTLSAPSATATVGIPGVIFFGDRNWVQTAAQGVTVSASAVSADGFWYFLHTGISAPGSTVKCPNFGGLVVDNISGLASSWGFAAANNSTIFGSSGSGPASQTISFTAPAAATSGATLTLTATASSNLPVTYSASPAAVCTVSGNTLSLLAAGTCSVTASQSGNASFAAATPVTQTITVNPPTASVLTTGCVFIMNPQATGSFYPFVPGTASGFSAGCDLYIISSANSLFIPSGNGINARSVNVVGPASGASVSGANINPTPKYGTAAITDPLAFLTTPTVGTCTATGLSVTTTTTLSPGTYCGGLSINGAAVTFNPGLYIISGPLTIQNGSNVKGAGVSFYLTAPSGSTTYGPLKILGSTVNLSAPSATATSGIPGVIFFGDRNWQQASAQGVTISASYVSADGFWYFLHTGISAPGSSLIAPHFGGLVVDNITGLASSWSFAAANDSLIFGPTPR